MNDMEFIGNDEEYEAVLGRIEELMDAEADTPEGDELVHLSTLVEIYENENFPLDFEPIPELLGPDEDP